MADYTFKMSADHAKVVQSFLEVANAEGKATDGFKKFGDEGKKADEQMARNIKTAAGMVIGYVSLRTTLALVNAEFEKHVQLQQKAAGAQMDLNRSRQELIRNLTGASPAEMRAALDTAAQVAKRTRVDEAVISGAMSQALGASGGDVATAAGHVEYTAKLLAEQPTAIGSYAASLLDIQKVTGSRNALVNAGYLQQLGAQSRVADADLLSRNAAPAVIGASSFGATAQEAGALWSALTVASGDVRGATSGTGTVALAQQLRDFFRARGQGDGTMGDFISKIQSDPSLQQAFLKESSFEKTISGPIEKLLTDPHSEPSRLYGKYLREFPSFAGLATTAQRSLELRRVDPLETTAELDRALKGFSRGVRTRDVVAGRGSITREGLKDALDAVGAGDLEGRLEGMIFEGTSGFGGADAVESAIGILEKRRQMMTQRQAGIYTSSVGTSEYVAPPSEKEKLDAKAMGDLIETLKELKKVIAEGRTRNARRDNPAHRE